MTKLRLYIANAHYTFTTAECAIFRRAAKQAEAFVSSIFACFDYEVDLIIATPSFLLPTIAEDSISGRTYYSRLIMLSIDKQQHAITEDFVFETICHELSHSLRWEKVPEYAETLFDGMMLEGLAVVLEEAAMTATQCPTTQHFLSTIQQTSTEEINGMIATLKDTFNSMDYDYTRVFFTGYNTLSRWAGYRLGYYFVKQYLEKTNRTIVQTTEDQYQTFAKVLRS
ncbi:MAG: DUF2268 domain-containing putative Zn-dependent protease [Candidatus Saccharibacteria bacterium]|nr:DUF2268 domain-containing putative Zn-dependent protease [Candidatus Saccharibacteria bacterium]